MDVRSQRDELWVGGSSPAELKVGSAGYPMTLPQRVRYDFGYWFNVEIILLFYVIVLVTYFVLWRREIIIKIYVVCTEVQDISYIIKPTPYSS